MRIPRLEPCSQVSKYSIPPEVWVSTQEPLSAYLLAFSQTLLGALFSPYYILYIIWKLLTPAEPLYVYRKSGLCVWAAVEKKHLADDLHPPKGVVAAIPFSWPQRPVIPGPLCAFPLLATLWIIIISVWCHGKKAGVFAYMARVCVRFCFCVAEFIYLFIVFWLGPFADRQTPLSLNHI